jgi:NAD-dependent dihydropyrimidine dehydrogenase PreA subunit
LDKGLEKTPEMRAVKFRWPARLETAVSWASPLTFATLLGLPWWREELFVFIGVIWVLACLIFLSFPLYRDRLRGRADSALWRQLGVALVFWLLAMAGLGLSGLFGDTASWGSAARWGIAVLVVCLVLSVDLMGSTPIYKSGTHDDRRLRIALDSDRCEGIGSCEDVCPTNVFEVDRKEGSARLERDERCVQCGACIVQCPLDALSFVSPDGAVVTPETVRKFKLNLMGKRAVKLES